VVQLSFNELKEAKKYGDRYSVLFLKPTRDGFVCTEYADLWTFSVTLTPRLHIQLPHSDGTVYRPDGESEYSDLL
jgi:hypothetical protein